MVASPTVTPPVTERPRAVAGEIPGCHRVRRAVGRSDRLRGLRQRRADHRVRAALDDRPFADLEGTDPRPRATAPGDRLGCPRQRPIRSPARSGGTTATRRSPRTCWPSSMRRARDRPSWSACPERPCRPSSRPANTRSGCSGSSWSVPPCPSATARARAHGAVRRDPGHRGGLGQAQHPLLATGLHRLPRVLLRAGVQRAALDQGDRGRRRLRAVDRSQRRSERRSTVLVRIADAFRALCRSHPTVRRWSSTATAIGSPTWLAGWPCRAASRAPSSSRLHGSGHCPNVRDPIRVNLLIRDFLRRHGWAA